MTEPTTDSTPFADLPPAITAMLRDEANLTSGKRVLEEARQDCLNRDEALRQQASGLKLLVSRKQREELAAASAEIQREIHSIDRLLARVNSARDRLHSPLRAALLDHMERADPLYRQGLRASRFHEHWRRGHALVADRLTGFLRDLKRLRAALHHDVMQGLGAPSDETAWCFTNLHSSSLELDREIAAFNQRTSEHAAIVQGTPFATVRLPTLEQWSCVARTEILSGAAPADALVHIDHTVAEFLEYRQPSLGTLAGMFEAAADEHSQIAEARLRQRWGELLSYAEFHLVSDADLEPTLADIERRLSESERARLSAQIPIDPFTTER